MPVLFGSFLQLSFPYHYAGKVPMIMQCFVSAIFAHILGLQCTLLSELPGINIEKILLKNFTRDTPKTPELRKLPSKARAPNNQSSDSSL